MPRYFFNIRDGGSIIVDREGIEMPSVKAVREEAEQAARDLLADKVKFGAAVDGQQFEILDDDGKMVMTVPFKSVLRME